MSVAEDITTIEFDEQSDYTEQSLTNSPGTPSATVTTAGISDGYESMSDDDDSHQNPMAVYLSKMSGTLVTDARDFPFFRRDAGDMHLKSRGDPTLASRAGHKVETREQLDEAKRFLFCK